MNLRFTAVVALIALALAAFALTLRDTESRQVGPGAPTPTPQPILELDAAGIEEVAVVGATGAYTLSRVAGGWKVDDQAAGTEVDSVVTTLAKPTVLRELPGDRKPEDYGFASPTLTVTLRMAGGESHVLYVGDKAVAEEQRYLRVGDEGEIVLVSNYDFERLIEWLSEPPLAPTGTPTTDLTPSATPGEGEAGNGTATSETTGEESDEEAGTSVTDLPTEPPTKEPTAPSTAEATAKPKATAAPTP